MVQVGDLCPRVHTSPPPKKKQMSYLDKNAPLDIRSRNLPHWNQEGKIQFVTFHQADSIPKYALEELVARRNRWKANHPEPWSSADRVEYRKLFNDKTEVWLDSGYGTCVLRNCVLSRLVASAIDHFDGIRYAVHAYVVMPNHVHVLLELIGEERLSQICKSWKNYTALNINRLLNRKGPFWHHESWDRLIRNQAHYGAVVNYICKNIRSGGVVWRLPAEYANIL